MNPQTIDDKIHAMPLKSVSDFCIQLEAFLAQSLTIAQLEALLMQTTVAEARALHEDTQELRKEMKK